MPRGVIVPFGAPTGPGQPTPLTVRELGNRTLNNPYNQALRAQAGNLANATRYALTPGCNPITGEAQPSAQQLRSRLIHAIIDTATAGDYLVIPTLIGRKLIYEIVLWNVGTQTLILQQGQTGGSSTIRMLRLTNFPSLTGFTLGFDGSEQQPHFEVDNGQPFVLNLGAATQVDGYVKYAVSNGTY